MKRVTTAEIVAAGLRVLQLNPARLTASQRRAAVSAALLLKAQEVRS